MRRLNGFDAVVVQHEYGIYGGPDGADVLDVVAGLTVPTIIVMHTVLQQPTAGQRHILLRGSSTADVVVTMTETAGRRLVATLPRRPGALVVIPHGATDHGPPSAAEPQPPTRRPLVLTWGLLGPGKGIEWAIEAMPGLRDLGPRYLVIGRTHPKVLQRDGERYRDGLARRARELGVRRHGRADDRYLDAGELAELVQQADVVLLPYDSREQVTSGVLIEAVAAGRPVVSTAFPHAIELLADGTGLVVAQRDPAALGAALRRVLSEPGLAEEDGRPGRPQGARPAVGRGRRPLPAIARPLRPGRRRPRDRARARTAGPACRIPPVLRPPAPDHRRRRALRARRGHHPAPRARLLPRRRGAGAGGRVPRAATAGWTTSAGST